MGHSQGVLRGSQPPCRPFVDAATTIPRRLNGQPSRASTFDLIPTITVSTLGRSESPSDSAPSTSGRVPVEGAFIEFPAREPAEQSPRPQPPLVRVRLSVHYRVHSRQMLCIGGSQIPFGWSFLSIAKVPMAWSPGDVWTAEVSHTSARQPARLGPSARDSECRLSSCQLLLPCQNQCN